MRRGGFGREKSDQPGTKSVTITSLKVLHPVTRFIVNVAWVAGAIATMFLSWDWRYLSAGMMVVLAGVIIGPWRVPEEPVRVEADPHWRPELGDDEVHL